MVLKSYFQPLSVAAWIKEVLRFIVFHCHVGAVRINPFTPRDCFWNTKYPDARRLPVLANGGPLLHTKREENRENTLLSTEQVPLQPDTKMTNSENRLTSPVMRAQYGTAGINGLNRVISRL